jgi:parvulin-like peptidyl-prolyl isomerase
VTLANLEEVSYIFEQMKEGNDFGDIIKRYGQTDSLVNNEGETGLKPVLLLGDLGKIAMNLELNEIYGPIQRNNSYSIIQLIERKDNDDSLKISFVSVRDELRHTLHLQKLNEILKTTTATLAEKYNVKIYAEVLNKIKITEIPMFIHRFMGFGGRIAGVPILTPFSEWIDQSTIKKMLP